MANFESLDLPILISRKNWMTETCFRNMDWLLQKHGLVDLDTWIALFWNMDWLMLQNQTIHVLDTSTNPVSEASINPCFWIKQSIFLDQPIHTSESTNPCFWVTKMKFSLYLPRYRSFQTHPQCLLPQLVLSWIHQLWDWSQDWQSHWLQEWWSIHQWWPPYFSFEEL